MKVTAVMIVRDEQDVVALNINYHRASGVDEVLVVDNGSSDGTRAELARLSKADPGVRWTVDDGPYRQSDIFTALAREAHCRGADWVLPTDADELWWSAEPLRRVLSRTTAGALQVEVVTYAQAREVRHRSPEAMLSMRWRPARVVAEAEARAPVTGGQLSFLEMRYPPKYASRPTAHVVVHFGNHHVDGMAGERVASGERMLLHAPVRAREQILSRRENGRRVAEIATTPDEGWHLRRLSGLERDDAVDLEWAACSVRDDSLDVGFERHAVIADDRLREAVRPFVGQRPGFWRRRPAGRLARVVGLRPRDLVHAGRP